MTTVSIVDQHRWTLRVHGRRIPSTAWEDLKGSQSLLTKANSLWEITCHEAEALREQARQEGFSQGMALAQQQATQYLLDAQLAAQHHLDNTEQRTVNLAKALLSRIVPQLASKEVITELLATALREVRAQRYLRIRVNPKVVEIVHQRLQEWRYQAYSVPAVEVLADPELSTYGCVVESELGTLIAGLDDQLQTLCDALNQSVAS